MSEEIRPPSATVHTSNAPQRASARFMLSHPAHFLSLGAGSGLSPFAPGTVGTLYAWLSFLVLNRYLDVYGWAFVLGLGFIAGVWMCGFTARALSTSDPNAVVWDEIVAFWLVLWVITPASLWWQLFAFLLFRFFDAAKPGPVGWADKKFHGGFGIMLDDLIAAACALFTLALLQSIWQRIFS